MSEARLERIETELGRLVVGQAELRTDVTELRTGASELRTSVTGLQTGQDELHRQMLVLHEQVIATIKAIPDPTPRFERMMSASIAELREEIGRRLDPLEAIVRRHFGT